MALPEMMASKAAVFFVLLAVLASLVCVPQAVAWDNLLQNPGFEEDTDGDDVPDAWRPYKCTLERVSDDDFVHNGEFAAKSTTDWDEASIYQKVPVRGGGSYTLSGWAINDDASIDRVYLRITWLDEIGNTVAWHDSSTPEFAIVSRVIDGDTIELSSGDKVRYIGIDTPEVGQCYSQEATDKNIELVLGNEVRLEKDVSETDVYGRLLRYVYVDDLFVNAELVRFGYARAYPYLPDIRYALLFLELEQQARNENRGLWGVCPTPTPLPTPTLAPSPTPDSGQYRFLTVAAQAPAEARIAWVQGVVRVRSPGTPANAYFDDLSFTGPPPSTPTPTPTATTPPTPGATPSPAPADTTADRGAILINEVQYNPPQTGPDADFEWVELYNATEETIYMEGWTITDNRDSDLIPSITLSPSDHAVIAATTEFYRNFRDFEGNIVFLDDPIGNGLSNDEDCLNLEDSAGNIIDDLCYGAPDLAVAQGHSLERSPAGGEFVDNSTPTPGYGLSPAATPTPAETPVQTATPTISATETPTATPSPSPTPEDTAPPPASPFSGAALRAVVIVLAIAFLGIVFWLTRRRAR